MHPVHRRVAIAFVFLLNLDLQNHSTFRICKQAVNTSYLIKQETFRNMPTHILFYIYNITITLHFDFVFQNFLSRKKLNFF